MSNDWNFSTVGVSAVFLLPSVADGYNNIRDEGNVKVTPVHFLHRRASASLRYSRPPRPHPPPTFYIGKYSTVPFHVKSP